MPIAAKDIVSALKLVPEARRKVWVGGFLKRRLIKFYVGEGFKINPESIKELAESGKKTNGTSTDEEVQQKAAFLCALTAQLKEFNDAYESAIASGDYDRLYDAILDSCDLRAESGYDKVKGIFSKK